MNKFMSCVNLNQRELDAHDTHAALQCNPYLSCSELTSHEGLVLIDLEDEARADTSALLFRHSLAIEMCII